MDKRSNTTWLPAQQQMHCKWGNHQLLNIPLLVSHAPFKLLAADNNTVLPMIQSLRFHLYLERILSVGIPY